MNDFLNEVYETEYANEVEYQTDFDTSEYADSYNDYRMSIEY